MAGFGLSFLAFGLLWIGVPWHVQFLMALPFLIAGYFVRRFGGVTHPVLVGLLPLGALIVQFRDKNDSHAMPLAMVSAWVLATLLGSFLARPAHEAAGPSR